MSEGKDTIVAMRCEHEHLECPSGLDCNSFCAICEGFGEYCPNGCEVSLDEDGYAIFGKDSND